MATPKSAASAAHTGNVHRNGMPAFVVSVAVVYMPVPKKAPWPKEK